jgi:superoxide dismutase, Cu-Zn family
MRSIFPALLVITLPLGCDDEPQAPLNRQTPADRSGAVGSADPRTGQQLPPATVFKRAAGSLEARGDGPVSGDVKLEEVTGGVRVQVSVRGAPRSTKLAVLVHDAKDCKDVTGTSSHFNPRGTKHGLPGAPEQHAGDLGNLTVDEEGKGTLLLLTSGGNLRENDPLSYLHRTLVVHEREDRGTEDLGAPLACARIEPG